MKGRISKRTVDRLRPGEFITDDNPRGFVARRLPSGVATYGFRYFDKTTGRQPWIGLGVHGDVTADQARAKALQLAKEVRDRKRPLSARKEAAKRRAVMGDTVNAMLDTFLDRYAKPNLRSAAEVERCFDRYVRPAIGTMPLCDVRRRDVVSLLDKVEDSGAPVMADRVLAYLRKAFRWHSTRDDQFLVPLVPGMARTKPKERERKRILDDQEIRDLYTALDALHGTTAVPKCFASFTRFLLLSAQRLRMVSNMNWTEIDGDDWIVPENRHKGKGKGDFVLPLTDGLRALIGQPGRGFVFTSDNGRTSFKGFSKSKAALDAKLVEIRKAAGRKPVQPWVYHDLRRSARSLMSRAKVEADHAERTLAHVIGGVRGVYDRYDFYDEKKDALEKLDELVSRILKPGEAVIRFPKGRKKR
jgi:integrase